MGSWRISQGLKYPHGVLRLLLFLLLTASSSPEVSRDLQGPPRLPLTGSVVDPQNGALPGVSIHITSALPWGTPVDVWTATDANGAWPAVSLPRGVYLVTGRLTGFYDTVGFVELDAPMSLTLEPRWGQAKSSLP